MKFYNYDGTTFHYEETFTLNDPMITVITASDDFGLVATGGTSNNMTVIRKNNASYEILYSESIGSFIVAISTDKLF